ncbi:MAG TPA: metallophosphoesterase family protein [Rhodothermales bacterium]|nr:metallophosphoesterase family protein [Rhodothermales bacterium]
MSLIAVGDLHGCAKTLDALLDRLAPTADDRLVFVGDYVDRGPDSRGVIDRLLALDAAAERGEGPACVFLRGNHDQMMLDYVDHGQGFDLWRANGGLATLSNYVDADGRVDVPAQHLDFLRHTRLYYDTPEATFVHAGLDPLRSVAENLAHGDARTMMWTRAHLDADLSRWEKLVVCGHTPVAEPLDRPRLLNIDTGAVYAYVDRLGTLTAVRLPERVFVQVRFVG